MHEHECPECHARYTSALAAEECGEQDRVDQRHALRTLRGKGKRKQFVPVDDDLVHPFTD